MVFAFQVVEELSAIVSFVIKGNTGGFCGARLALQSTEMELAIRSWTFAARKSTPPLLA
jgi:hypothetical protein